ncbi:MAG TPA: ATP-grasp domain-containing protein [Bryobacteraceae bacterium]|nr:ATP-grasp domain-containing protein [Bryobacteraceae bacterium]
MNSAARIAVLYEHPQWFAPLFEELRRRGRAFDHWPAASLIIDPQRTNWPEVVVNRMSTSAQWRGHGAGQFAVLELLELLEARGVQVVNGARAYSVDISKVRQVEVCRRAGVRSPRTIAVNDASQIMEAARRIGFPVIVKPNCGGSGSGVQLFETPQDLQLAAGALDAGCDRVLIVQEVIQSGDLLRTEVIDGQVLYTVKIDRPQGMYHLCPADACAAGASFTKVLASREIENAALAIARAARIDAGGIECFVDPRTGEGVFYDINALSNFVTNPVDVLGFNPMAKFADAIERRLTSRW